MWGERPDRPVKQCGAEGLIAFRSMFLLFPRAETESYSCLADHYRFVFSKVFDERGFQRIIILEGLSPYPLLIIVC